METMRDKVVVFGDSILKGVFFDDSKNKYQILKKSCVEAICESQDLIVENYSKFGMTTDRAIEHISRHLSCENNYKYAIVELGGNDSDYCWSRISENPYTVHYPNVKLENFEFNIRKIIEEIRKYQIIPIIVTMPPISSNKYFNWFSKTLNKENILEWLKEENNIYRHHELYNLCLYNIAYKLKVDIIDIRLSLLTTRDYERYLCIDGIHLNEDGHNYIAKSFSKGEMRNE